MTAERFEVEIVPIYRPLVMRGLVADWPVVAAARKSTRSVADHLLAHDRGAEVEVMVAEPQARGRFFYRDDMTGFNFERQHMTLHTLIESLLKLDGDVHAPTLYAGATAAPGALPGWADAHPMPLSTPGAIPRLWLGNASHVSTHYDTSANIACVAAGTRRFTLFPPDQLPNLYVGPLDRTVAGQPTSMVDLTAPDLARYPRFAEALDHALVVTLEPGDALYIPPLWWHDVQASGALTMLVNYWWATPVVSPVLAMAHAMMALRGRPGAERRAWAGWFDHYVFGDEAPAAGAHLPDHAKGALGVLTPELTTSTREYIAWSLRRR